MATQPQVVQFDQASSSQQQQQANQPGWFARNKSWAVPTATFAGGVAVGVGAVKAYDWLTSGDDEEIAAPAAAPRKTAP